jgi:DNA gyrase subunit B
VERARFDKMLGSAEIGTLIAALGTGIGRDEFNADKTRYHKIIIMTDADVDGSHIRTLLLTFFFRQMPELIDRGYLYIAQPPLYRIKRGNAKERYLKDDRALEEYLIEAALSDLSVTLPDGTILHGAPLRDLVEKARSGRHHIDTLARKSGNLAVIEQASIVGGLSVTLANDPAKAADVAGLIASRLNAQDSERGWSGEALPEGGYILIRSRRGVTHRHRLDGDLLKSAEARKLDAMAADLKRSFEQPSRAFEKQKELRAVTGPMALFEVVMELGRRGVTIQRYKGLGEMNPEQLWETTLDPTKRSLLQVRVNHADQAEEVFSTLMGDIVEPRREFIQENALKVSNLDV